MYIFTGHRWSSWSSLFVCLWAVSDIMVWLWCCVSLQHALRASGPVQRFYSGTKPVMHCHGHAHTPMRETRKDTFFFLQRRRLSSSSTQPNVGVSACFLCACRAVCFDLDALDSCWFFFHFSHLIGEYVPSGDGKLPSWQQKKQQEAAEELLLNSTYFKTEDSSWRS